jgi:hypothetical protein
MNKIIIALIGLALMATPALACIPGTYCPVNPTSDVRTSLWAQGDTSMNEQVTVSGWYDGHGYIPTAGIIESIQNDGTLSVQKQATNFGQWNLQEDGFVYASGETSLQKEIDWWTVDPTESRRTGELKWPTVANIYTSYVTNTVSDKTEIHNTADQPGDPYGSAVNTFLQSVMTSDIMNYKESVGINEPLRCDVQLPIPPTPPVCLGCPTD